MSRPTFDPFADDPTQPEHPEALGWIDPTTWPAYAEDAHGNVLFDHREHVTNPPGAPSSARSSAGEVVTILALALALLVIGREK